MYHGPYDIRSHQEFEPQKKIYPKGMPQHIPMLTYKVLTQPPILCFQGKKKDVENSPQDYGNPHKPY
jgi:hypothetical protein